MNLLTIWVIHKALVEVGVGVGVGKINKGNLVAMEVMITV